MPLWPPGQGLCLWTPLGTPPPTPPFRRNRRHWSRTFRTNKLARNMFNLPTLAERSFSVDECSRPCATLFRQIASKSHVLHYQLPAKRDIEVGYSVPSAIDDEISNHSRGHCRCSSQPPSINQSINSSIQVDKPQRDKVKWVHNMLKWIKNKMYNDKQQQ